MWLGSMSTFRCITITTQVAFPYCYVLFFEIFQRKDTASVVDDADKLTKTLQNWCDLRRKKHTEMELKMQEETKSLQSASKLLLLVTYELKSLRYQREI
jgi:hypothetical protein